MLMYIARRLGTAVLILFAASFVVYQLVAASGDPLDALRASNAPNKAELIAARTQLLHLDVPGPVRYFMWLRGVGGCAVGSCDLGRNLGGQAVTEQLGLAVVQTLQLVVASVLLAMVVGITLGVITALRQYSAFDYLITFVAFLCFSLPIFWVAVLLKVYGAIKFNDFLENPTVTPVLGVTFGAIIGVFVALAMGGSLVKRVGVFVGVTIGLAAVLMLLGALKWFTKPVLGLLLILLLSAGAAVGFTALFAGLRNRKALYSGLICAGIGAAIYFPIQMLLQQATGLMIVILAVVAIAVGWGVGQALGGYDRGQNRTVAILTSLFAGGLIMLDKFMQTWPAYVNNSRVKGRPIATMGASTPNLEGNFWLLGIDKYTHVLLPTLALMLISLAAYTRYTRSAMLEVMNMDYVRTARAKGLTERVVVVKHAFRNALIPLATIIAFAIGGIIGGAVITESVFGWSGTGTMFIQGIKQVDPNPVMAVFMCTALMAMLFNLVADLTYSLLDPRVRVK